MLGNSINIDLSFLTEKDVIQIGIGRFSVEVVLDEEMRISCQSTFELTQKGVLSAIAANNPQEAAALVYLVGKRTAAARGLGGGDLQLDFDDNTRLIVRNSNAAHESYVVWNKGDFIAV